MKKLLDMLFTFAVACSLAMPVCAQETSQTTTTKTTKPKTKKPKKTRTTIEQKTSTTTATPPSQ